MGRARPVTETPVPAAAGATRDRPVFGLTAKIALLWFLPLAGALAMLAIAFYELRESSVGAPVINLAGRQRMLSQQFLTRSTGVREGREEDRASLKDLVVTFHRALDTLEHGGVHADRVLPAAPAGLRQEFAEVRDLWRAIMPALLVIAEQPPGSAAATRAYRHVRANMHLLTQASDRLVGAFQERAMTLHNAMFQALALLAGINGILLLVGVKSTRDYVVERQRSELALRESQERLQYLAHYDPLTGLPNRMLCFDRLEQALARARWHKRLVAVLLLDLDRFKTINDTLGHYTGDRLLREIATRWKNAVRDGDTVARLGGDEFVIVLADIAAETDVLRVVAKIVETLNEAVLIDGQALFATTSIGISFHPTDGGDVQTLIQCADVAMYWAKKAGRVYQFYSPAFNAQAPERLALENDLRNALARGEFLLHFQPIVDLLRGQVIGIEALLRWRHPERGILPPAEFVPLLEDTGLIVAGGEWVIANACTQARGWQERHGPLRLAVNLSALQFRQHDLARMVERACVESGFDAHLLDLELTESVFLEQSAEVDERLQRLREVGARIVIDDFGTGYSSLNYLRRLPVSHVKIDRAFVQDITVNADAAAIVRAIISLAHSLKITVIAEGVETAAQAALLRDAGCDAVQGFLYSPPLPAEDLDRLLRQGQPLQTEVTYVEANRV